jgi:hypothetical protein
MINFGSEAKQKEGTSIHTCNVTSQPASRKCPAVPLFACSTHDHSATPLGHHHTICPTDRRYLLMADSPRGEIRQ